MCDRWGRIRSAGRERIDLHPSRRVAQIALKKWLNRKRRRGYPGILLRDVEMKRKGRFFHRAWQRAKHGNYSARKFRW